MIGSTDLRFTGNLDTVRADADELEYVLREVNLVLPRASLTAGSVLLSYSGVRPLPFDADKPEGRHSPAGTSSSPRTGLRDCSTSSAGS